MMFCMDGPKGQGSEASLSRVGQNSPPVASGPDFKKGVASEVPSRNTDLAPTVLYLLGVKPPQEMDGRILFEALAASEGPPPKVDTQTLDARRDVGFLQWRQYLKFSRV